ncbi:hypothetical protein PG997_012277 [Apiospora hydei]|uniref:Uncharacterized protein n=1 Tax=Apiospora hydei TaxID=1337664 RepID=A0ABR1V2W3_9PEZI
MSSTEYTIQQYLLDRANIQDTVNKIVRQPFPLPFSHISPNHCQLFSHPLPRDQQTLYYDTDNAPALADECYAPGDDDAVTIDYTSMFAGRPLTISNRKWAADAVSMLRAFDAKQHVVTGLVIERLPQPAVTIAAAAAGTHVVPSIPDSCTVVANVNGHVMRKAAAAEAAESAEFASSFIHNGVSLASLHGRYEFDLVRIKELEEAGKNPWRVRKHKCILTWSDGNPRVMEPMKDAPVVTRE